MTERTKETKMNDEMTDREKLVIRLIAFTILLMISLAMLAEQYRNTIFFEDGSFIFPNGWSGCLPWAICAVGG